MTRTRWIVLAAVCATGCDDRALERTSTPTAPTSAVSEQCLSVVSWNDLHGTIEPDRAQIDLTRVPSGGIVAVADAVDTIRKGADVVVLLDAGDEWTGPLETTLAEGEPIVAAYDVMGVDAAAIGNHDFDFGPVGYDKVVAAPGTEKTDGSDGPRGALLARMASATYPYLSANIHFAGGGGVPKWNDFHPSAIVTKGAWKVGVVGYTTKETPKTTLLPNVADLEFAEGAAKSVAAEIRSLRAAGASPVVLVAHASMEGELPQTLDDEKDPQGVKHAGEIPTLVAQLGDDLPDLIVAGHRHGWMLGRVRGVPIVSSDQHGVGIARARFCMDSGTAKLRSIEPKVLFATPHATTDLGARVEATVKPFVEKLRAKAEEHVATLQTTCMHQAVEGTAYAEQIARAIAEKVADAKAPPPNVPVVGLINAGGLRAPLFAGEVKFRDLFSAVPFENAVAVCATTKAGLQKTIDNAFARPSSKERFPFGIVGAKVVAERESDGTLVRTKLAVDGGKSDAGDAPVWIALPDFILWGGDGLLDGVTCTDSATSSTRVRDAWRALLSKENGGCDGRPKNVTVVSK